jgi:hypothetical protein
MVSVLDQICANVKNFGEGHLVTHRFALQEKMTLQNAVVMATVLDQEYVSVMKITTVLHVNKKLRGILRDGLKADLLTLVQMHPIYSLSSALS